MLHNRLLALGLSIQICRPIDKTKNLNDSNYAMLY